ncbi:MAG: FHA domain-containing protein [Candidatus Krumholzibacteriota bacterium]|nr:FHA domain-containing protein [Candidatus Krumholzibacteriota bacterium]
MSARNSTRNPVSGNRKSSKRKKSSEGKKAAVEIVNGCFSGLVIDITGKTTTFGSDIDCDICLDHSFVSSEHAVITGESGSYYLEDLNSRHGTSIGGREIHKVKLNSGDLIGIGNFQLKFKYM